MCNINLLKPILLQNMSVQHTCTHAHTQTHDNNSIISIIWLVSIVTQGTPSLSISQNLKLLKNH